MKTVHGNVDGVRRSYIERLEAIYDIETDRKDFCTAEIIDSLAFFTEATGKEAMVYIDRSGRIMTVCVGEQDRVSLPSMRMRRSDSRLSGIRCIHTHPGGNALLSPVDVNSLKKLKLDAMAAVGVVSGVPNAMHVGILDEIISDENMSVNLFGPYKIKSIPDDELWDEIISADNRIRPPDSKKSEAEIMRAVLVGIDGNEEASLDELRQLADTAGFITVGSVLQHRPKADNSYYLGYGKLHDLVLKIQALNADAAIFDDELTPGQIRSIQKELGKIEIIDRTTLILDIFSSRASTHEGRLQVELAHTKYLLPRMQGFWTHMTRMAGGGRGGGGARRGEGETQLEVDRRLLRRRLSELEREINKIKSRRDIQRMVRESTKIPVVALVGYTNAGKSTLMNRLSDSEVLAEDKLFATLDPVSRSVNYGFGEFLLVDTVGFINKLPHDLVNAFRATLEETKYADLLLHVVDASSENKERQMEVVGEVLTQLEANNKPQLVVYNKCDKLEDTGFLPQNRLNGTACVAVSASTGMGTDKLKQAIADKLSEMRTELSVLLPLDSGALISRIYKNGQVIGCDYQEDGIHVNAIVTARDASKLKASALEVY